MAKKKDAEAFCVPLKALKNAARLMRRKAHRLLVAGSDDGRSVALHVCDGEHPRTIGVADVALDPDVRFPPYETVIPDSKIMSSASPYWIDPEYLGRFALLGKMGVRSLRHIAPTDPLSPIVYKGDGRGIEVTIVVMPRRK
jgi:hypothetical protein